jgi:hypothetical protein
MQPSLKQFTTQNVAVIAASLPPVTADAFFSVPLNIGDHPGWYAPMTARLS